MSAFAQPQNFPPSLVTCLPYKSSTWNYNVTVTIENLTGKTGAAEFYSSDPTKEVCDAAQNAAKKANLSTTRLANDRLLIHGNIIQIYGGGVRLNSKPVPAVCTTFKELGFNITPDQILEDLSPAAVAKGFELKWMNQHNEEALNVHRSRIGSQIQVFVSLNNDCVVYSDALSIGEFRWKLYRLKLLKNQGW